MASGFEIEGRLTGKLAVQSGRSSKGDWARQDFLLEVQDGNFPSTVCFSLWGADRVKELEKYQVGDTVKVSFNPVSREYNGKWYTDLRAWRLSGAASAASAPVPPPPSAEDIPAADFGEDLPF
ncbi:MAG: DUF3127 domain-containing protein [Bacteroidales bacterium]|jgi:hypothetical protein|nr:DUF3127 domain-containing protein [Bacteroidales bacterium]